MNKGVININVFLNNSLETNLIVVSEKTIIIIPIEKVKSFNFT